MQRGLQRSYWKLSVSVKWVSVEEGIHVIYKELCTNFKQTGFTFSKQAGKRSIWKVKQKLIKAEVRNCPAHLLLFPAPAALPGYWLLGWHPPDPNRWSLQGKGAKPLSSLPICLGGNGSLGWSWHSVQACLCNRGSHCLEAHYNLSPASTDYEGAGWEWSCFIHEPASQEHPLSSWANNNMAWRWVERRDSACLPAGPRLAQDLARRNLNGYQVGLWALQRFDWQCQQLTLYGNLGKYTVASLSYIGASSAK